jgi:hypothetical protein
MLLLWLHGMHLLCWWLPLLLPLPQGGSPLLLCSWQLMGEWQGWACWGLRSGLLLMLWQRL